MRSLPDVVDRLCEISTRAYQNPYEAVEWPEAIAPADLCMSPELVSLYGTPVWEGLSAEQRTRLAFHEAINFFSLNIHGEKALIEGLAARLYAPRLASVSKYIHHFLDEENKHMVWFGTFCTRYARGPYPEKKMRLAGAELSLAEEDFLFFLKVAVFEELVDVYNARMAKDDRLVPVARRINFLHHQDEMRHLAFGRLLVQSLFEELRPTWSADKLEAMRTYAADYLRATWREYYNPDVYRDAGLAEPYRVYKAALASETTRGHRRAISGQSLRWLREIDVFEQEPSL